MLTSPKERFFKFLSSSKGGEDFFYFIGNAAFLLIAHLIGVKSGVFVISCIFTLLDSERRVHFLIVCVGLFPDIGLEESMAPWEVNWSTYWLWVGEIDGRVLHCVSELFSSKDKE